MIYGEHRVIENGYILIQEGKIKGIYTEQPPLDDISESFQEINAEKLKVIPGFIDGHIHGLSGADIMDGTHDALATIASGLPKEGTTSFVATTITHSNKKIESALETLASYKSCPGQAELLGIHLEGPFIAKTKAGAQSKNFIQQPNLQLFREWQFLANQKIKTVTLAPELDQNNQLINELYKDGINVSAGHTDASFEVIKDAVRYGLKQVTHLCNAMSGIHHRNIGVVGAAFQLSQLRAELIADGIHVSEKMLQLIFDHMGSDRLILITDSMRAKNLPTGHYELGGQSTFVSNDRVTLNNGVLAGSILRMIDGVKRMLGLKGVSLRNVIEMASINPAKQLGVFDKKGSIAKNKDADLLLVDDDLNIKYTICQGILAFKEE